MAGDERRLPVAEDIDMSLGLLRDGYDFVGRRCDGLGSDLFETRLLGKPVICARGAEAARLFYDEDRFTRDGAMPKPTLRLLQDEGSVATLEGQRHRVRKALFLSLMTGDARARMRGLFGERWRARLCPDEPLEEVVLHEEAQRILCESVLTWCGIEVEPARVPDLTKHLAQMIEGAATLGPLHWRARRNRRKEERALAERVERLRAEAPADRARDPLHAIAFHEEEGQRLDAEVAAVEILNLLRPTVAIARFIAFAGHALAEHPQEAERCRLDDGAVTLFVREVRRFYPFFPMIVARVRHDFTWQGYRFPEGWRVILDLYGTDRDPKLWTDPGRFDPSRHEGRESTPFDLIPQGGGDHWRGHRCAGEWMTVDLVEEAVRLLTREMRHDVPPESLEIDRAIPAKPANGFVMRRVRGTAAGDAQRP